MRQILFLAAALLLAHAPLASAQDEAVLLRSGQIVVGQVTALDDAGVTFSVRGAARTVAAGDIEPTSLYELKARRVTAGDGKAHLALAEWCLTRDLVYFAEREFGRAAAADPGLAEAAEAGRKKAALLRGKALYERAVKAMQARRYAEAITLFSQVIERHPVPFAGPARKALDHIRRTLEQESAGGAPQAAGAGPGAGAGAAPAGDPGPLPAGLREQLAEVSREVRAAADAAYQARTDSRARKLFEQASTLCDRALLAIDQLRSRGQLSEAAHRRLRDPFVQAAVEHALQVAVIYLREDNEWAANRWLSRALVLDPDNQRARELRTFIITEYRDEYPWYLLGRRQRVFPR